MSKLVWSPVYHILDEHIQNGDPTIFLIVPFIKVDALRRLQLLERKNNHVKVIARWRPDDLISGATDVEVFTYLKEVGCSLYVNNDIHMKLYVFESNVAFNTSANLTLRGLGYIQPSNIEVGNLVNLTPFDWSMIHKILLSSRQVDDAVYERARAFIEGYPETTQNRAEPDFFEKPKRFTIGSLPAVTTPAMLAEFYFASSLECYTPEDVRRATHDLAAFGVPFGLTRVQFEKYLGDAFRKSPFVISFIEFLKTNGSLRFGAVNDWLHKKCEDVPLPYRWQIKENTAIFYDWLAYLVPEISWDRPNHSQVIYWQKKSIR